MLFTEPVFLLLYLPLLLWIYFAAPRGARNHVLTCASLVFYAVGEWRFLPWLVASTLATYAIAIGLDRWRGRPAAKHLLVAGIAIDLGLLFFFKYAGFFARNLNSALAVVGCGSVHVPSLALPLGISFFTFHKISYKIDVARGVSQVRRDPLDLFLYIALFPQLIAGPIVRYHEIVDDLVARNHRLADFAAGVRRFIVGFAKKMLLANTVALCADQIFALPMEALSWRLAWLGVACYTAQIYLDFSGYSDMAIGLARMFGFRFPENFNYPYGATSITEFWRRWHMSLSRWFRDYLYIPLGGNRISPRRTYVNLLVVFLLCGLWHGASWTFVVWGLFHGGWQIVERLGLGAVLVRAPRILRHAYTMLLVMIGWVFFRIDTMGSAWQVLRAMFGGGASDGPTYPVARYFDRGVLIALVVGFVIALPVVPAIGDAFARITSTRRPTVDIAGRLAVVVGLMLLLLVGGMQMAASGYNPFIYFRF